MHWTLFLAALLLACYLAVMLTMTLRQRRILYIPERDARDPEAHGWANARAIALRSGDGTSLAAWHVVAREGFPTILYYHGNAGHLGHRLIKFQHFAEAGFGLLAVSYRGYGGSEGAPTERGVHADAEAVYAHAVGTLGLPATSLLVYGESLGSGIAVRIASQHRVAALVLEAPYTSVVDRAAELYPYLPVRLLLRDRFESLSYLPGITAPVLVLHGEKDMVIPVAHGRKMLEAVKVGRGVFYPGTGHTDFDLAKLTQELLAFACEHGLLKI